MHHPAIPCLTPPCLAIMIRDATNSKRVLAQPGLTMPDLTGPNRATPRLFNNLEPAKLRAIVAQSDLHSSICHRQRDLLRVHQIGVVADFKF